MPHHMYALGCNCTNQPQPNLNRHTCIYIQPRTLHPGASQQFISAHHSCNPPTACSPRCIMHHRACTTGTQPLQQHVVLKQQRCRYSRPAATVRKAHLLLVHKCTTYLQYSYVNGHPGSPAVPPCPHNYLAHSLCSWLQCAAAVHEACLSECTQQASLGMGVVHLPYPMNQTARVHVDAYFSAAMHATVQAAPPRLVDGLRCRVSASSSGATSGAGAAFARCARPTNPLVVGTLQSARWLAAEVLMSQMQALGLHPCVLLPLASSLHALTCCCLGCGLVVSSAPWPASELSGAAVLQLPVQCSGILQPLAVGCYVGLHLLLV